MWRKNGKNSSVISDRITHFLARDDSLDLGSDSVSHSTSFERRWTCDTQEIYWSCTAKALMSIQWGIYSVSKVQIMDIGLFISHTLTDKAQRIIDDQWIHLPFIQILRTIPTPRIVSLPLVVPLSSVVFMPIDFLLWSLSESLTINPAWLPMLNPSLI